ncbi:MAG: hypothetical protein AAFR59_16240, partial [Bacteroidota bacterium]
NEEKIPAFGMMYAEEGREIDRALLDFNRENDRIYIKNATPALAMAHQTYDVYSVSGHGIGGTYRPFRSDVGMVRSPDVKNTSGSLSIGAEFGVGGGSHLGLNIEYVDVTSRSGAWTKNNVLASRLRHIGRDQVSTSEQPLFEPSYMQVEGESGEETDPDFYTPFGNAHRGVQPTFSHDANTVVDAELLEDNRLTLGTIANTLYRTKRKIRNQLFVPLTASEASEYGLIKDIRSYELNQSFSLAQNDIPFSSRSRVPAQEPHAISEVSVLRQDGVRYVYGIPTLNHRKKEVTFNVSGNTEVPDQGLTVYQDKDASIDNDRGIDHYYDAVTTPTYAYSYLLTSVLSPDYVDQTGNGPSDDDLGSWHHIKYHRHHDKYNWRFPIGVDASGNQVTNLASHIPGFKVREKDDKGSYVYGERENW